MKRLSRTAASLILLVCAMICTSSVQADWDVGDGHKMHYPQLPNPTGWDVSFGNEYVAPGAVLVLADDFLCTASGPITNIHIWISFKGDTEVTIDTVHLSIHNDIPTNQSPFEYSVPDVPALWETDLGPGQFMLRPYETGDQKWYDPMDPPIVPVPDHQWTYQINCPIDANPFVQEEGTTYWLDVEITWSPLMDPFMEGVGWKTSTEHWNDDAVWAIAPVMNILDWNELRDPFTMESLDLAFVIQGATNEVTSEADWGDAPVSYGTTAAGNGPNHVVDLSGPWLGDASDAPDIDANGQPQAQALGDDGDADGDDEDGAWFPRLIHGVYTNFYFEVANTTGVVQIWLDTDGSGTFEHPGEMIYDSQRANGGYNVFLTPSSTWTPGWTFARCRISSAGGLTPLGAAADGEVEDHHVLIEDGSVNWAAIRAPTVPVTLSPGQLLVVTGQVWMAGVTGPAGPANPMFAELGYGPDGVPPTDPSWVWMVATYAGSVPANDDAYVATVSISTVGRYDFVYRFSRNGINWTYGDNPPDGSTGAAYEPGDLIIWPPECPKWTQEPDCDYGIDLPSVETVVETGLKWQQLPDLTGWDVYATVPLACADDFLCTDSGPITEIVFWGSWKDIFGGMIPGGIGNVHLSIYTNIPGPPSLPGVKVWDYDAMPTAMPMPLLLQGWYDPLGILLPDNHDTWQEYHVYIPRGQAFTQQVGEIYWLGIQVSTPMGDEWGWKSTDGVWNDVAVWGVGDLAVDPMAWEPLAAEPLDLAFEIWGDTKVDVNARVADDWRCDGRPVTAVRWWGSYLDWPDPIPPMGVDRPSGFILRWYTDIPADESGLGYSMPGFELTNVTVTLSDEPYVGDLPSGFVSEFYECEVSNKWNGLGWEHEFEYYVQLEEPWMEKPGRIYWLSIEPYYAVGSPNFRWGWKTTYEHDVIDDAVVWIDPDLGEPVWWELTWPEYPYHYLFDQEWGYEEFTSEMNEGPSLNMAFELLTDICPNRATKWSQLPDMMNGTDMMSWRWYVDPVPPDVFREGGGAKAGGGRGPTVPIKRADDFVSDGRPITDIHWWGSYSNWMWDTWGSETNPVAPPNFAPFRPLGFELSWHLDDAGIPGFELTNIFVNIDKCHEMFYGTVHQWWIHEGYYEHEYQYYVDLLDPLIGQPWMEETNGHYWLDIQAVFPPGFVPEPQLGVHGGWGWKVTTNVSLNPSVVSNDVYGGWVVELRPPGEPGGNEPFDLAFELTTDRPATNTVIVITNITEIAKVHYHVKSVGATGAGKQWLQMVTNLVEGGWSNILGPIVSPKLPPEMNTWNRSGAPNSNEFYRVLEKK